MINKLLFFVFALSISLGAFFVPKALAQVHEDRIDVFPVRIFLFHSDTCPHCKEELEFLAEIEKEYPNIELHEFSLSGNIKNQSLFYRVVERENLSGGVPTAIIADEVIVGFDNENGIGKKIIQLIEKYSQEPGISWLDDALGLSELDEDSKICLSKSEFSSSFVKKCETETETENRACYWSFPE